MLEHETTQWAGSFQWDWNSFLQVRYTSTFDGLNWLQKLLVIISYHFSFFVQMGSCVSELCRYKTIFSFIQLLFVLFILTQQCRCMNFVVIEFDRQDWRRWRITVTSIQYCFFSFSLWTLFAHIFKVLSLEFYCKVKLKKNIWVRIIVISFYLNCRSYGQGKQ